MKNISPFAERIKSLIRERNLTQRQVAEAAEVTKNAVGKWIRGTVPGAVEVFKLARAFGKPMEWFLEGTKEPDPSKVDEQALATPEIIDAATFKAAIRKIGLVGRGEEWLDKTMNYRQVWRHSSDGTIEMYYEQLPPYPQPDAAKIFSNNALPHIASRDNIASMQCEMQKLRERLIMATAVRGQKSALARWMGTSLSSVSHWLSGNVQPSGETALRLLHWVQRQEDKQQQSASSVIAPPAPKTQSQASNEKKPRSSPQKR